MVSTNEELWLDFWKRQEIFSSVPTLQSMPLLRKTFLAITKSGFDRLMSERKEFNFLTVFPKSGFFPSANM